MSTRVEHDSVSRAPRPNTSAIPTPARGPDTSPPAAARPAPALWRVADVEMPAKPITVWPDEGAVATPEPLCDFEG